MSREDTIERIMTHATAEFARYGLAGARVDRIAAAATTNKQRIYAYFNNKSALFDEVLAHSFESLGRFVRLPSTIAEIPDYVASLFDFHTRHPDLGRLLLWEQLELERAPGGRVAYHSNRMAPFLRLFPDRPADEVVALVVNLVALAAWPANNRQVVADLHTAAALDSDVEDFLRGRVRESVVEQAGVVLQRWIEKAPA